MANRAQQLRDLILQFAVRHFLVDSLGLQAAVEPRTLSGVRDN
jgi:hypothetical protein